MSRIVVDLFRDHRVDDANVVGHLCMPWQEVTDHLAALAILGELGHRPLALQCLSLQLCNWLAFRERFWHWLVVHLGKLWFVVKCFQMRWTTSHAEKDDSINFWWMMRQSLTTRAISACRLGVCVAGEQRRKRNGPQTQPRLCQEGTAIGNIIRHGLCLVAGNRFM